MSDGIPKPLPPDALTGPAGPFPLMEQAVATAETLRQHGEPTIAQTALGIARAHLGEHETPGRPNEGPIVDWCLQGLTRIPAHGDGKSYLPGWAKWCAYFVMQCVRQALLALGPGGALLLLEWLRISAGAGDCDVLWAHLEALGCTWPRENGALPEAGNLVFFGVPGKLRHVGFVSRAAGVLVFTVEGNSRDRVAEQTHNLADPACDVAAYARLPF